MNQKSICIRIAIKVFVEFKIASPCKANYYILLCLVTCTKLDEANKEVSNLRKIKMETNLSLEWK